MKLKRYSAKWASYGEAKSYYDLKKSRSRTYGPNGSKAIRLDRPINNTILYEDGKDMVFCLYDTNILRYTPEGTCEILSGGYYTPTTFGRIFQITGVTIGSHRSNCASIYRSRVATHDGDVPYFDGLKFDLASSEVLNEQDIPSDLSKTRQVPTVAGRKRFKAIWKETHPRVMFGINLGAWAEDILERGPKGNWYTSAKPPESVVDSTERLLCRAETKSLSDLELQKVVLSVRTRLYFNTNSSEGITETLRVEIPTVRSKLQFKFCKEIGELEDKGGEILGGSYYVNPKDRK